MVHQVKEVNAQYRRIMVRVVKPPHHVNGDPHHHSIHFEAWVELPGMEAYHDPDEPDVILVPAMCAIVELGRLPGMGYAYWSQQDENNRLRMRRNGVHETSDGYDGFFRLPADCCEVSELVEPPKGT